MVLLLLKIVDSLSGLVFGFFFSRMVNQVKAITNMAM
jgi:hypothetical protein